jgi:hypothetical protein
VYIQQENIQFSLNKNNGLWLIELLGKINIHQNERLSLQQIKDDYEQQSFDEDFELFWFNKVMKNLQGKGLVLI